MKQSLMSEKYLRAAQEAGITGDNAAYSENELCSGNKRAPKWTTGLTVVCVFFMLISFFGFLSASYGLYGMLNPPEVKTAKAAKGFQRPKSGAKDARDFTANYEAAEKKFFPVLLSMQLFKLALAMAFTVAVVMIVSRSQQTRNFVFCLCGLALLFHAGTIGINLLLVYDAGGTVAQMLETQMEQAKVRAGLSNEEHEKAKEFVVNSLGLLLTIVVAVMFLVRLLFYGAVIAYFCQAEIKPIFGEDSLEYLKQQGQSAPATA